jgi:hypothetical protein|tara:strand:- start:1734 stop:2231 length:498 start_codon:yes stop_codon:yes gene_type:complete
MSISVGDFAEQILAQDELRSKLGTSNPAAAPSTPSFYSPNVTEQAPDISGVEVPDGFIQNIVEGKELPTPPAIVAPAIVEEDRTELRESNPVADRAVGIIVDGLGRILEDVKVTLDEVKELLNEQTTVGNIGVNLAPTKRDKKSEDSYSSLLKKIKSKRKTNNKS